MVTRKSLENKYNNTILHPPYVQIDIKLGNAYRYTAHNHYGLFICADDYLEFLAREIDRFFSLVK